MAGSRNPPPNKSCATVRALECETWIKHVRVTTCQTLEPDNIPIKGLAARWVLGDDRCRLANLNDHPWLTSVNEVPRKRGAIDFTVLVEHEARHGKVKQTLEWVDCEAGTSGSSSTLNRWIVSTIHQNCEVEVILRTD